jgi:hypothetical protein
MGHHETDCVEPGRQLVTINHCRCSECLGNSDIRDEQSVQINRKLLFIYLAWDNEWPRLQNQLGTLPESCNTKLQGANTAVVPSSVGIAGRGPTLACVGCMISAIAEQYWHAKI